MSKQTRLVFILMTIFTSVILAWMTLATFFGGVGINFVALLLITIAVLIVQSVSAEAKSRTRDFLWLAIGFTALESLVYLIFEYQVIGAYRVFFIFQIVYSVLGLFLFAYLVFRLICEIKGVRFSFIERMLGNSTGEKIKKVKPASQEGLGEKPNTHVESEDEEVVYGDDKDEE